MAALSSFYSSVRLYAQQCPDATIDKYLIEATREFCKESWYYQQTMLVNQVAGTQSYQIVPSNNDEVHAIDAVQQEDQDLTPLDQHDFDSNGREPIGYLFEPPNYLVISPNPTTSVANGLEVRLILLPPENATAIADSIYRNFKETIVSGALSKILKMQNEAWSNSSLADMKLQEFYVGIFNAKGQRARGFRSGSISMKPRPFLIK